MTTPYTTGTITLTNGNSAVVGVGTAWVLALIAGGVIFVQSATGNVLPIASVVDDTHITASLPWQGASGTYSYALLPDTSYDRQVLANANALAQIIQALQKPSVNALASLAPAADKLAYFTGANTAALATLTSFARTFLNDADAGTALSTLGVSAFAKTLLDDADASAALGTLGVSTFIKTLLDDASASAALSTLGISAFAKTLLDDADATTALSTLGMSTLGKSLALATSAPNARALIGAAPVAAFFKATAGVATVGTSISTGVSVDWTATGASIFGLGTFSIAGAADVYAYGFVNLYSLSAGGTLFYTSPELTILHKANGYDRIDVPYGFQGLISGDSYRAILFLRTNTGTVQVDQTQIYGLNV